MTTQVPLIKNLKLPVKHRKEIEKTLQKYFDRNEKTKSFAEISTPFLPDELDNYLNKLTRHDFVKTLFGFWVQRHSHKTFKTYFNRSWLMYRSKFTPFQKDKDFKKFAISIHKALANPIREIADEIVEQESN